MRMAEYAFGALMARMNYICRWGLMRNSRQETLSEHSLVTAVTAHILALLAKNEFMADDVEPERVACAALYHDASEIMTGDLPTPVKYRNERLRAEYKAVEREATEQLAALLPDSIRAELSVAMTSDGLSDHEKRIIKAADKLSALIKCIEEEENGNAEFESAKKSTLAAIENAPDPETTYYLKHFVPAYSKNLDELLGQ